MTSITLKLLISFPFTKEPRWKLQSTIIRLQYNVILWELTTMWYQVPIRKYSVFRKQIIFYASLFFSKQFVVSW